MFYHLFNFDYRKIKVWTNSISGLLIPVTRRNMRNSHTHFWVVDWVVENSGGKRCSDKLKNLMKCGTNFRSGSKTRLTTLSNLNIQLLASSSKAGKQLKVLKFIYSEKATKIWRGIQNWWYSKLFKKLVVRNKTPYVGEFATWDLS